jgi:hypothetical protein
VHIADQPVVLYAKSHSTCPSQVLLPQHCDESVLPQTSIRHQFHRIKTKDGQTRPSRPIMSFSFQSLFVVFGCSLWQGDAAALSDCTVGKHCGGAFGCPRQRRTPAPATAAISAAFPRLRFWTAPAEAAHPSLL